MSQPKRIVPTEARGKGRDYGYCNARVRGMRSHLLSQSFLDQLMGCKDMRGIIQELSNTEYGPDLEGTVLHGQTFTQVDEALKNNMVRLIRKVLGFVNGEAALLVNTLLGRWDLFNIKTIIRGKHMHLPAEEIADSLIAMGQLKPVELRVLTEAEDVRAVVDTLYTWDLPYAVPLREQMPKYVTDNDLTVLELALDRYYTGWAAGQLKGRRSNYKLARGIVGVQTDSINLLSVFRLLKADVEGMDVASFFLPGGKSISEKLFVELAGMSDIDEVLDRLKGTPYGKALGEAAMRYLETNSVATLERTLEDYVVRKAISSWRGDPLGAGVIISYLWAKENEVTNLRIIVKGNSVGMPADRVRRELIVV
jgi:V/A-type H+/Na+-transporting ATPase subunit C